METRPPDSVDLLVARLGLHVGDDPMGVVDEWTVEFERLRAEGREGACERLLAAAKGWALPAAHAGVIAFSEGWLLARRRHSRRAVRAFERALAAFSEAGVEAAKPVVLLAMAGELEVIGDTSRAAAVLAEAGDLAEPDDDATLARITLDRATLRLATAELSGNELSELERGLRAASETFRSRDDAINEARTKVALGYALERRGRAGDAQRELTKAVRLAAEAGDGLTHFQAVGALGTLALGAGELANARSLLEAALTGLLTLDDLSSIGRTHASLGALSELEGDLSAATRHRRDALATYEALEDGESAQKMRALLRRGESATRGTDTNG